MWWVARSDQLCDVKGCTVNLPKSEVRLASTEARPRTGVFTLRNSAYEVSRGPGYEFEDKIVQELEPNAVFVEPMRGTARQPGLRAKRWLERKGVATGELSFGAATKHMEQDLDLFFAAPAVPHDLLTLTTIRDWRKRSKVAVCYLQELWISEFDTQLPGIQAILQQFDHIFVGLYHTADALSRKLGRKVEYLPLGIDAELWNPYTGTPKPRVIDACAIGNMDPDTHQRLWDWAERTGRYYNFTSIGSAKYSMSHVVHRQNLAQTLQRSKFFFTYMAKRAVTTQRGTQLEFGPRYFEGAGAGAIQLGDVVKTNAAYLSHVNWEGAVIEAPFTDADLPALIEEIEKDEAWIEKLRRQNVAQCLTRHDHLNRWDVVLKAAGLKETPAASERRARLEMQAAALLDENVTATQRRSGTL